MPLSFFLQGMVSYLDVGGMVRIPRFHENRALEIDMTEKKSGLSTAWSIAKSTGSFVADNKESISKGARASAKFAYENREAVADGAKFAYEVSCGQRACFETMGGNSLVLPTFSCIFRIERLWLREQSSRMRYCS